MKRLIVSSLLAFSLLVAAIDGAEKGEENIPRYHLAKHGFNGGFIETVNLTKLKGFDKVLTLRDVAEFASKVPDVIGFIAHPKFESGERYAEAVLWYTKLSPTELSWPLYLLDETEAKKSPGDTPKASAVAAAEAKVSGKLQIARELIAAGGLDGVTLSGDPEERKILALAVMRLNGFFKHTGEFGAAYCVGCRNVVSGGTPWRCGLGIMNQNHWNCCGASKEVKHCRYWELLKAQKDADQADKSKR